MFTDKLQDAQHVPGIHFWQILFVVCAIVRCLSHTTFPTLWPCAFSAMHCSDAAAARHRHRLALLTCFFLKADLAPGLCW